MSETGANRKVRNVGLTLSAALHLAILLLLLAFPIKPVPPAMEPQVSVKLLPAPPKPPELTEPAEPQVEVQRLSEPIPNPENSSPESPSPPLSATRRALPDIAYAPVVPTPAISIQPMPAPASGVANVQGDGIGSAGGNSNRGDGAGTGSGGAGDAGAGSGSGARRSAAMMDPDWIVRPTDEEMQKHNPWNAKLKAISGTVVLACLVASDGRARKCRVLKESPEGHGFAVAGLKLSRRFRIKPPQIEGRPRHDVPVRIPIFFDNHD